MGRCSSGSVLMGLRRVVAGAKDTIRMRSNCYVGTINCSLRKTTCLVKCVLYGIVSISRYRVCRGPVEEQGIETKETPMRNAMRRCHQCSHSSDIM